MSDAKPHLRTLDEIERECIPGLVEVLRQEGVEGVRYALWDMTGWHRDYDPCVWRHRATQEQKRAGWEMWVRMERILCTVLNAAHEQQIEETMDALSEGPESFYKSYLDR
jgi:hypothetical protein